MLSRSCDLVFTVCSRAMIAWCRPSRIELILVFDEFERLGGGENGLSLILEALGEAVDLLEQSARHLAQCLRLTGKDRNGFL